MAAYEAWTVEVDYASAVAIRDGFDREVSSGWGSTPGGQAWNRTGGSASDFNVSAGLGTHFHNAAGTLRESYLDIGTTDFDIAVDLMWPVTDADGGTLTRWICGRYTDSSNYYVARLDLGLTGDVSLSIRKRVAGVLTDITSAVTLASTYVPNQVWRVRFTGTSSTLQAWAWIPASEAMPATPTLTGTDSSLITGTNIALLDRAETGNTNVPITLSWDNLAVYYLPSSWTDVTADVDTVVEPIRSTNGATAETTGEPASMTLVLNNAGFKYTPANLTSPFALASGMPIRFTETVGGQTFHHFTGFVAFPEIDSVNLSMTQDQMLRIAAVDQLSLWENSPTFISTLAAQVLGTSPAADLAAFWPLADPGSQQLDAGPNQLPAIRIVTSLAAPGAVPGPDPVYLPQEAPMIWADDISALKLTPSVSGGLVQRTADMSVVDFDITTTDIMAVSVWFYDDGSHADDLHLYQADGPLDLIHVYRLGGPWHVGALVGAWSGGFDPTTPPTQKWCLLTVRVTLASGLLEWWLDDRAAESTTMSGGPGPATSTLEDFIFLGWNLSGAIGYLQVYAGTAFDRAAHLAQYQHGHTGLHRQHTGERVRTLAGYAGLTASELTAVDTGCSVMARAQLAGKTIASAMYEARDTERGDLFIDGSGQLTFHDRRTVLNI